MGDPCINCDITLCFILPVSIYKHPIYITIIMPVFVYGCESWSLTLMEERRLWVYGNRVLRRIFGPNKDKVTREWRKLHNE